MYVDSVSLLVDNDSGPVLCVPVHRNNHEDRGENVVRDIDSVGVLNELKPSLARVRL